MTDGALHRDEFISFEELLMFPPEKFYRVVELKPRCAEAAQCTAHAQLYSAYVQQMSASPPPVVPRKPTGVRVLIASGELSPGGPSVHTGSVKGIYEHKSVFYMS